jgi:hypothetical protein
MRAIGTEVLIEIPSIVVDHRVCPCSVYLTRLSYQEGSPASCSIIFVRIANQCRPPCYSFVTSSHITYTPSLQVPIDVGPARLVIAQDHLLPLIVTSPDHGVAETIMTEQESAIVILAAGPL